jgi:hypothetical protein
MSDNSVIFFKFLFSIIFLFIIFFLISLYNKKIKKIKSIDESFIYESIKKVFKLSILEIKVSEIYKFDDTKKILFFKLKKKALIVVSAKVMLGFDFFKSDIVYDLEKRKIIFNKLPDPEILSIETNYDFYDIEQSSIHKFNEKDLNQILSNVKKELELKILKESNILICKEQLLKSLKNFSSISKLNIEFKDENINNILNNNHNGKFDN